MKIQAKKKPPINDGFTEYVSFRDVHIAYRPLVHRQRGLMRESLSACNADDYYLFSVIGQQILFSNKDIAINGKGCLNERELQELSSLVIGINSGQSDKEKMDCKALREGVYFHSRYPKLAQVDCGICRKYWFDPIKVEWTVVGEGGQPVEKPNGTEPLCDIDRKACPVGHYNDSRRLTGKYIHAYEHYQECVATGNFPDDGIVARNAVIIREAIQHGIQDR